MFVERIARRRFLVQRAESAVLRNEGDNHASTGAKNPPRFLECSIHVSEKAKRGDKKRGIGAFIRQRQCFGRPLENFDPSLARQGSHPVGRFDPQGDPKLGRKPPAANADLHPDAWVRKHRANR